MKTLQKFRPRMRSVRNVVHTLHAVSRGIGGDGGEGERTAQISGEKRGGGAAKP